MRVLLIILSILSLSFMCDHDPVRFIDATSESWTGGMRGSGRGTNYRVTVVVDKSDRILQFDTLWVGKRAFPVKASRPHPFTEQDGFGPRDTVIIFASLFQPASPDGDLLPLPAPGPGAPVSFDGDGLLSYRVREKLHYVEVDVIRELPTLDYP